MIFRASDRIRSRRLKKKTSDLRIRIDSMETERTRTYDVVLFGATGFTGAITAKYLASVASKRENVKWAIAGRNAAKLTRLRNELKIHHRFLPDVIVADSKDASSLRNMTAKTKVVATTVGPYIKFGPPLVDACVKTRTHYVDLTGEYPFVRDMIDKYHTEATIAGVKIVHCCGYDCIPVDLAVMIAIEALPVPPASAFALFTKINGAASGGTLASVKAISKWAKIHPQQVNDPYILAPGLSASLRADSKWSEVEGVRYNRDFGTIEVPYFMAVVDNRVVRRSLALRRQKLSFDESMSVGAVARAALFALLHPLSFYRSGRQPGEGPSENIRRDGSFSFEVLVKGETPGEASRVKVTGIGDPGYAATSVMLAESALCLAFDDSPALNRPEGGGVLTPSVAMGWALVRRLRRTGHFTFEASVEMPPVSRI